MHILAVQWLLGWTPTAVQPRGVDDEGDAIVVEIIPRRALPQPAAMARVDAPSVAPRSGEAPRVVATRPDSTPPDATPGRQADAPHVAAQPATAMPLDLHVTSLPPGTHGRRPAFDGPAPPNRFERPPPVLPSRPTRFERAWEPHGDALAKAAWRSPIVRGALNAFGGPPKKCDEVERRLRKPNCLPDEADFGP